MYTTTNENGILNNYPVAPKMYYGSYPDGLQQRSYLMQGLLATTFVGSLLLTALACS
ncbi:MAG: ssl1498 family light-harvesting-like protein [Hormoscilla sp. GM102CHS1]|nr:ssl1498 family light-harvesting-like protein [Hormoscilla sp. GM102CHS1]MBC6472566.1 ssl1498 family light-harvesting-like protein [Hormoscilla sp. GM102CHS1]